MREKKKTKCVDDEYAVEREKGMNSVDEKGVGGGGGVISVFPVIVFPLLSVCIFSL